jgi:hypothetical protein
MTAPASTRFAGPAIDRFDGAGALERVIDEEHLERDVGLDMRLAEERKHLAVGESGLDRTATVVLAQQLTMPFEIAESNGPPRRCTRRAPLAPSSAAVNSSLLALSKSVSSLHGPGTSIDGVRARCRGRFTPPFDPPFGCDYGTTDTGLCKRSCVDIRLGLHRPELDPAPCALIHRMAPGRPSVRCSRSLRGTFYDGEASDGRATPSTVRSRLQPAPRIRQRGPADRPPVPADPPPQDGGLRYLSPTTSTASAARSPSAREASRKDSSPASGPM